MRSIFDDHLLDDERETIPLFQGEFPGYKEEEVRGKVLKQEEKYYTLDLNGIDISPIVAKKRGKRIAIDLDVYFETRVPGKFHEQIILGKGEAFYFPDALAIYIQDLYIRQAPGKTGKIIPIHKHSNTIKLWKSFEEWLKKTFPEAKHITTPEHDLLTGNFKALLRSLGYTQLNYILFQKQI